MVNESMSVCVLSIEPYEGAEIEEDAQFSIGEFFNGTVVVQDDRCIPQSGRNQLVVHCNIMKRQIFV